MTPPRRGQRFAPRTIMIMPHPLPPPPRRYIGQFSQCCIWSVHVSFGRPWGLYDHDIRAYVHLLQNGPGHGIAVQLRRVLWFLHALPSLGISGVFRKDPDVQSELESIPDSEPRGRRLLVDGLSRNHRGVGWIGALQWHH